MYPSSLLSSSPRAASTLTVFSFLLQVEPNRRWFGNTRTIGQEELQRFRDAVTESKTSPYTYILRQNKLPMSLLQEPERKGGQPPGLLTHQSFETTFGPKAQRKKPNLAVGAVDELAKVSSRSWWRR